MLVLDLSPTAWSPRFAQTIGWEHQYEIWGSPWARCFSVDSDGRVFVADTADSCILGLRL